MHFEVDRALAQQHAQMRQQRLVADPGGVDALAPAHRHAVQPRIGDGYGLDRHRRAAIGVERHLRRAEQVIRQNLSEPSLSPEFVAEACGISKRYLHELFSDTNKTVSQFIREARLIAARDLIATARSVPMAEVAYRHGFSDQAQFSRVFRSLFGQTPSDWRRETAPD